MALKVSLLSLCIQGAALIRGQDSISKERRSPRQGAYEYWCLLPRPIDGIGRIIGVSSRCFWFLAYIQSAQ